MWAPRGSVAHPRARACRPGRVAGSRLGQARVKAPCQVAPPVVGCGARPGREAAPDSPGSPFQQAEVKSPWPRVKSKPPLCLAHEGPPKFSAFPTCPARTSQTKATSPQTCQPPLTCRLVHPWPRTPHVHPQWLSSPASSSSRSQHPAPALSHLPGWVRHPLWAPTVPWATPHRPVPALSTAGDSSTSPVEGGRGHEGRAEAVSQV